MPIRDALVDRRRSDVDAFKRNFAAVALIEPGERVEERRFPGAIGSDDCLNRSGVDAQRNVLDRAHAAEVLEDVRGLENDVAHG